MARAGAATVLGERSALPLSSGSPDEATRFVNPDDERTRFEAVDEEKTRFVSPDEERTRFADPAPSDHALTIAAVSDSLADSMTVASPITPSRTPPSSYRRRSHESGPLDVGQSFGPRYHIIRLLGTGGMGAVYQAWDAELGVAVAIKVIRPEVMEDPVMGEEVSRRFKRELLLARQVTHKNVVRIHDLGDIDGIKYITMSYVEGTDLSSILKKDGKRPVRDLLPIARSVASGLVAAHTAGVVHRDLKPANIMISKEGEALIMDFGIAHSTGEAAAVPSAGALPEHLRRRASEQGATTVGSVIGTLEYMAPEQARGQSIDQRVDVYAFGLILYDALLGRRRAGSGESAYEELQRRLAGPPPPLHTVDPELPAPLVALVERCVEPDAEKRFQTSADLVAELDRLDEAGNLIPVKRVIGLPLMAAIVTMLLAAIGGTWWYWQGLLPPLTHDPVRVAIADFVNSTGDPAFDGVIEPIVRRGLEDASFITAFDRTRLRSSLGVNQKSFKEEDARLVAFTQGLDVVLSGTVARQDRGYRVSVKVTKAVDEGDVVVETSRQASNKDQVLEETARLILAVREALGDTTSDDEEQLFTMRTMTATRLDVAQHYAAAFDAQANGRIEETQKILLAAVALDPKTSGLGYQGLAMIARNLDNIDDAKKYIAQALGHLDGMTEREKLATRGVNAIIQGSPAECVTQYKTLLDRFAADAMAHNQRALCLSKLRKLREVQGADTAVGEMRKAVQLLPKRALFRANLAAYSAYGSDFPTALKEAEAIEEPNDYALLGLAFAQLGLGDVPRATQTYQKLAGMGIRGASWSAAGLGDLAIYQGRYADAVRILEPGATADVLAKFPERGARKLISVAYAHLLRNDKRRARAAADQALTLSQSVEVRFLAGRILVETGEAVRAQAIATDLAKQVPTEPHTYGRILEGEIALSAGDVRRAITVLTDANDQMKGGLDTWLGHFALARAYQAAEQFVDAESHFDLCIQRRGEALSLLLDEVPTYGYLPIVYYLQGQTREKFNPNGVKAAYDEYLKIRGGSTEDRFVPELRRRAR